MKRSARYARRKRQYLALQLDRVSLGWWVRSRFIGAIPGWPARSADKGVEELLELIDRVIQAKAERAPLSLPGASRAWVVVAGFLVLAATVYFGAHPSLDTKPDAPPDTSQAETLAIPESSLGESRSEYDSESESGSQFESDADTLNREAQQRDSMASELGTLSARQLRAVILGERQKLPQAERNARSALEVDAAESSALLTQGLIELFAFQNRARGRALIAQCLEAGVKVPTEPTTGNLQMLQGDDRGFLLGLLRAFDQGLNEKQRLLITQLLPGEPVTNPRLAQLCSALQARDRPLARHLIQRLDAADRLQILSDPCLLQRLNQPMNQDLKQAIVIPRSAPDNA